MQLKNLMESHAHRITQKQCEELISDFAVNDERGEIITLDLAFLGQFHAHWYVNSAMIRGKPFNYYFGKADGSNGAYPIGRTSIVLTPEEMGFDALPEIYGDVPIFYGMMLEAQSVKEGDQLGPIGARAVADLMASTLDWGRDAGEGLWHPRWDGAPSTVIEIEKYLSE